MEGRLDLEQYDRLLDAALAITRDPAFGLRIGEMAHGPRTTYHRTYARVFGDVAEFGQPFAGVVLSRELLDAIHPNHDAEVQAVLEAQAARRITRLTGRVT
jgi:hypothetical protein